MTRIVMNVPAGALLVLLLGVGCASQPASNARTVSTASTREYVTTRLGDTLRVAGPQYAPKVLTRVDPYYPAIAAEQRTSGLVKLLALIDTNGNVVDAEVLEGLPNGLSEAAVAAVKQWTFEPTIDQGRPIPVQFELYINFKLH